MTKTKITKQLSGIAGCLATASLLHAQSQQPLNSPTPPVNAASAPVPPPPPGLQRPPAPQPQMQTVSSYKGSVVKLIANDDYIYDGFYMVSNGDSLLVKFPPHLGKQITAVSKPNTSVSVSGVMNTAPNGRKEIRVLSVTAGGQTISDTTTPGATPPAETFVSGNGKITRVQTNEEGNVTGLVIDDKTILRIPPHMADQLRSIAKTNATVAYTGMKKDARNGEAAAENYAIVHGRTLTLNGTQYLVQ